MTVRTVRTGRPDLGSTNTKINNPDQHGWVKSQKDIPNLQANLNDEVKAVAQYEEHKEQTDDPGTAAVLDHIQEEEEGHKEELKDAIKNNEEVGETLQVTKARPGKPYSQQQRQHGKGAGKIVGEGRHGEVPEREKEDLDREMEEAVERDNPDEDFMDAGKTHPFKLHPSLKSK